jgi:glucosamine--fructose-6-phosphate aminotransferase (isomerizing)
MEARGQYTREEILSQPETWMDAIAILEGRAKEIHDYIKYQPAEHILFTGCGSTYYLSCAAATLFQEVTGLPALGIPASELWLSPQAYLRSPAVTLLIAVSRSGETSETIQACELFHSRYVGRIVTLVCDPNSHLAQIGSLNLCFPTAMEKSVAQTRAFSTLYLGALGLSLIWAQHNDHLSRLKILPVVCRRLLAEYSLLAKKHGRNLRLDRVYFLGSGARFGLARELNLKMKEMSLTHSEAFHFLEFRHGPQAMVNHSTLIVGLVSGTSSIQEMAVLEEMRSLGATIIAMGEHDMDISFESGLEEVLRNILYLPLGQILAFERSIAKDLDPDHPNHLNSVVKL